MPQTRNYSKWTRRQKKKYIKAYPDLVYIWDLLNPPLFSDDE